MKLFTFSLIFNLLCISTYAQIDTDISLGAEEKDQYEEIKSYDPFKQIKLDTLKFFKQKKEAIKEKIQVLKREKDKYSKEEWRLKKKAYKDSIRSIKNKKHSVNWDSLKFVYEKKADEEINRAKKNNPYYHKGKEATEKWRELTEDSISINVYDSIALKRETEEEVKKRSIELEDEVMSREELEALKDFQDPDVIGTHQKELDKMTSQMEDINKQASEIEGNVPNPAELMAEARQLNVDHFEGHNAKISSVQEKMAQLKRKYKQVNSIHDLKNAVKRSSLKGEPLKKRLLIGGNLNIQVGRETAIDFAPFLGYKFTKRLRTGVSGTIRMIFKTEPTYFSRDDQKALAFRYFWEYAIAKGFFAHAEYERFSANRPQASITTSNSTDQMQRQWGSGALLGLGKEYNLSKKFKGQLLLLYDFLHDENSYYPRPWTVRFGFNWKGK